MKTDQSEEVLWGRHLHLHTAELNRSHALMQVPPVVEEAQRVVEVDVGRPLGDQRSRGGKLVTSDDEVDVTSRSKATIGVVAGHRQTLDQ
jgi:hypothetical protein